MSAFEPKELRQVFSQFPTGVTIITTRSDEGEPIGMTASSFNTVSIDPPLILWSIDKRSLSLEVFKTCTFFAVNILSDHQIALSNKFSGRGEDKFSGVEYSEGECGCPLIKNTLAQLICKNWNVYEAGDHLIMVGEVVKYYLTENARPLVFSQGSYAQANPHYHTFDRQQIETLTQQDFLNNHLLYLLRATYNRLSEEFYERLNIVAGVSPEMWRVYACLANGQSLSFEILSDFVMQPPEALLDTLNSIKPNVQLNDKEAQLTNEGVQIAQKLLLIAEQYKIELSNRVGTNKYEIMKNTLRELA